MYMYYTLGNGKSVKTKHATENYIKEQNFKPKSIQMYCKLLYKGLLHRPCKYFDVEVLLPTMQSHLVFSTVILVCGRNAATTVHSCMSLQQSLETFPSGTLRGPYLGG